MTDPPGIPPVVPHSAAASSQVARYLAADAPPVPLHYLTYLFEHVADVIFFLEVLDGDRYRFSAVNERFTLTTGLPVSAVVGKEVDQIIPPASLELVKSKYREAIATRKVVQWQEVSSYPTGIRTGDVTVSPVIEADGTCRLLMGVVHDVTEHHRNQQRLAELEERWRLALEYSGAGAWEWQAGADELGGELTIFPFFQSIIGMGCSPLTATRETLRDWVHPDDTGAIEAAAAAIAAGKSERLDAEARVRHHDGHWVWIRMQGKVVFDAARKPLRMLGTVTDISVLKAAQHSLELGSLLFENSHEAIAVLDPDGRIETVNPAFTAMRGFTADDIAGKAPRVYNAGLEESDFDDALWAQLRATGQWQGELWSRHKDGHVIAEYRTITAAYGPDRRVRNYIDIGTDITETKRAEELAWRQGNYDVLTGLPNRQMFLERVARAVQVADRDATGFTLLVIDLDRFKDVNETLGHSAGDEILREAAQRLLGCTRDGDTVARLGGDEFTVLLAPGRKHIDEETFAVDRTAQAIIQAMASPFALGGETLHLSASIGITHYPKDAADMESLVKHADQAMYVAKQQGRNRYTYFSHVMQERAQARRQLTKDLRSAIDERRLDVHYQPIVDLATGALKKAESLVRWTHPQRGTIGPAEFIPLCEETGLIVELGEQIFETVVRDVVGWKREHDASLQVGINVSPMQLLAGREACERCFQMARDAALPEHTLVVEVTEGMLLDNNPFVVQQLRQIAEHGMDLSLDDFGTGYSSLSYLKKFKFQFLKIDRSFVMHLEADTTDYALCETIVTMAHKLGMLVIAEGIETPEQLDLLKQAGCDYGQGYLFSKAVPGPTIEGWLANGRMPWMRAGFAAQAFKRAPQKLS
ncbi:EAL domain-containing protein [Massilia sp. LXY-6]|uniref:sensor domain-containing protein n=1 Tax=Massilia sp. LXY-6 TaxID=3379823 RepID=UPI003EE13236